MKDWQQRLKAYFPEMIEEFDDDKKVIVISSEIEPKAAREIEKLVQDIQVGYDVRQL